MLAVSASKSTKRMILQPDSCSAGSCSADEQTQQQLDSNIGKEISEDKSKKGKYSRLPENRKEERRKKQREAYHARKADTKKWKSIDHSSEKCSSYAMLPEEKKEEIRKKKREAYHLKKRTVIGNECISSFEIGSTSQQHFVNDRQVPKRKRTDLPENKKEDVRSPTIAKAYLMT